VTKAVKGPLLQAFDGKRIDAAHPIAVEYLTRHDRANAPPPATGLDPMYEAAVELCRRTNRYTMNNIRRGLKIGMVRANAILATMTAAGVTSHKTEKTPKRDTTARPVSGVEAARATKKSEALDRFSQDPAPNETELREIPDNLANLADWTIRDVIHRWGTDTAFVDWLKAVKEIEMVAERRLKNAQARGELISRHVVKSGMIDTLDGAFTRMLTDGAKTIATRTHSLVKTGAGVQEIEDLVAKQLSTFIKPTKAKITRVLRNA
jgi:hypothetical protein